MPLTPRRSLDEDPDLAAPQPVAGQPEPEAEQLPGDHAALLALQQAVGNRAVSALMKRGGARLPEQSRASLEETLGQDFSEVEIHTGPEAAGAADALGAQAYTAGSDIGFARGQYNPGTPQGDALLRHELAHVAQNRAAAAPAQPGQVTPASHASESQASAAARSQPTALNAAPAGLALFRSDEDKAGEAKAAAAVTPPAPGSTAGAPAAEAGPDAAREEAIGESIDVAETRARSLLNTAYNDVQDAARDFAVSTTGTIENLPGAPSGHWSVASTLVGLATSVVSAKFYKMQRLGTNMTRVAAATSVGQTYLTGMMTESAEEPKTAAKAAMHAVAKTVSYAQSNTFDEVRDNVYGALIRVARTNPEAAQLLADGSTADLDRVLTEFLGVPDASDSMYGPVREKLEVTFSDWVVKQERRREFRHIGTGFDLPNYMAEPGRAAARARVAAAVAERSGEEQEPTEFGAGLDSMQAGINKAPQYMMMGLILAVAGPEALEEVMPSDTVVDMEEDELVKADPMTEAEIASQKQLGRGIALADTRAREFLNSHYNDVQDAVRDFVSSAEQQIDDLPGPPSDYLGLVPALFSGVMGVIGARFPAEAVGKIIATAAASATGSTAKTLISGSVAEQREARKAQARQAMQALASGVATSQAGIFNKARKEITSLLAAAAIDPEVRILLTDSNRASVDSVITGPMGIPHPDELSLYSDVREKLELPFHQWATTQRWLLEGMGWMMQFRADEMGAKRQIASEAAMREGGSDEGSGETEYLIADEDQVTAEAGEVDEELARDKLILRRLTDVDSRARGFLNGHHDAVQDAVRDFVASANTRIDGTSSQVGDILSMLDTLVGVTVTFMFSTMPVVGAIVGAATALAFQGISSYHADQTQSAKSNAKRGMREFSKLAELGAVSGFKKARTALSPMLLTMALTDEEVRAALEIGGQDQIDAVIEIGLGISKPENATTYEDLRKALETEFVNWLSAQQELSPEDTQAAVEGALADADEDAKLRRGEKGDSAKKDNKGS